MSFATHPARWATLGLALALGIAACTTPTTTEVDMGKELKFHVPLADFEQAREFMDQSKQIADWVSSRPQVDDASVNIQVTDDEDGSHMELTLVVWGQGVDPRALIRDGRREYPMLAEAEVDTRDLVGEVHESFARKVARQALRLEVTGDTAQEIRANIMQQLMAAGLADGAEVSVEQADGQTTIGVTVNTEGQQTEDVIELLGDEIPEGVEIPVGGDLTAEGEGPVVVEKEEIRK